MTQPPPDINDGVPLPDLMPTEAEKRAAELEESERSPQPLARDPLQATKEVVEHEQVREGSPGPN
jgi:hypothetical protein